MKLKEKIEKDLFNLIKEKTQISQTSPGNYITRLNGMSDTIDEKYHNKRIQRLCKDISYELVQRIKNHINDTI